MVHPSVPNDKTIRKADPNTIHDKFLVGYQGWFTCGGDGEPVGPGHHGWMHWFDAPIPAGGFPHTDLWPDVSEYDEDELFAVPGLKMKNGEPAKLFSSRKQKTVRRHFHWMAMHGVDGAFLQRFATEVDIEAGAHGTRRIRDEVLDNVQAAAEAEGRVFSIMYDVTDLPSPRLQHVLEQDFKHLVQKGIFDSPSYLKEKGHPVIAIWGLGTDKAGHTPEMVLAITNFIRRTTPGGNAYIMAGSPTHWRTSTGDASTDKRFLESVWLSAFDAISPWTVGRYRTDDDADYFWEQNMKPDVELLRQRAETGHKKVDYIPVILPGGSGCNMTQGNWAFNDLKRNGGRFMWRQIVNAKRLGVTTIYGAMWDEYDEGTVLLPVVEKKSMLPKSDKWEFMALDEDGYDLPSDWYMRICGFASEALKNERRLHESFPSKELQDYWSTRPKFETKSTQERAQDSAQASYEAWLLSQKDDKDEPPPPPYSLEAMEAQPGPSTASSSAAGPSAAVDNISSSLASQHISAPAPPALPSRMSVRPLPSDLSTSAASGSQASGSARPGAPPRHPSSQTSMPTPSDISGRTSTSPPPRHPSHQSSGGTVSPLSPQENPASGAWASSNPNDCWTSSLVDRVASVTAGRGRERVTSFLSAIPTVGGKGKSPSRPLGYSSSLIGAAMSPSFPSQSQSSYPGGPSLPSSPPPSANIAGGPPAALKPSSRPNSGSSHGGLVASPPHSSSPLPSPASSYPGMRPASASPPIASPPISPSVSTYPGQMSTTPGPPPIPPKSPVGNYHADTGVSTPVGTGGGTVGLGRYSTYTAGSGPKNTAPNASSLAPPVPPRRPASAEPSSVSHQQPHSHHHHHQQPQSSLHHQHHHHQHEQQQDVPPPPSLAQMPAGFNTSYDSQLSSGAGPGGFAPPSMMPMPSIPSGPSTGGGYGAAYGAGYNSYNGGPNPSSGAPGHGGYAGGFAAPGMRPGMNGGGGYSFPSADIPPAGSGSSTPGPPPQGLGAAYGQGYAGVGAYGHGQYPNNREGYSPSYGGGSGYY